MATLSYDQVGSIVIKTATREFLSVAYMPGINAAIAVNKVERNNDGYGVPNEINTPLYSPDALPNGKGGYNQTSRWDGYMSSSLLGMPVMCYVKFVGGNYIDLQGNVQQIPNIIFENVLMTVTMNKNIVFEDILGRDTGSVKEYIGMGDWDVEMKVAITSEAPVNSSIQKRIQNGVYPRDNMLEIMRLVTAPIALPVECWFLQQFGINYLVVNGGMQVEQIEGEYSLQKLTIPFVSDNPLVITIAD